MRIVLSAINKFFLLFAHVGNIDIMPMFGLDLVEAIHELPLPKMIFFGLFPFNCARWL